MNSDVQPRKGDVMTIQDLRITVGGLERRYLVHAPANLPVSYGVVMHCHGGEGTGEQSMIIFRKWQDRGVVLAMPYGEAKGKSSHWVAIGNGGSQQRDRIDEDFLVALAAKLRAGGAKWVCLSGFSSGGGMTHHLYAYQSDKFDAFAPCSKGLGGGLEDAVPPVKRPVRFMFGTLDPNFADDGSDGSIDADSTWDWYMRHFGCSRRPEKIQDRGLKTTSHTRLYSRCSPIFARVYVEGMDHRLPKDEPEFGDPYDGPDRIVEFYQQTVGLPVV